MRAFSGGNMHAAPGVRAPWILRQHHLQLLRPPCPALLRPFWRGRRRVPALFRNNTMPAVIRKRSRPHRLTRTEIDTLFTRLAGLNPNPSTELEYRTPFELLIAVILSAQATDVGVNKATRRLFPVANTPAAILELGEAGLKRQIATLGLYNAKARNIMATCRMLLEHHGGEVPRERAALEALPGVGRKTANVVLNTVFGERTIAVDTHIFRISNRIGLAPGKTVREVEDGLMRVIPKRWQHGAHHWLILHGRYVCKARRPDCPQCVIADLCRFADKTRAESV